MESRKKNCRKKAGETGEFFNYEYIIEDSNGQAFLKVISFNAFFQLFADRPIFQILHEQSNAWASERDLLAGCRDFT